MNDLYDEATTYFTNHPDEIYEAWGNPDSYKYGFLFSWLNASRRLPTDRCGCPAMIKSGRYSASGPNAEAIERTIRQVAIPTMSEMSCLQVLKNEPVSESIIEALPLFAEIQRMSDLLIPGRVLSEDWRPNV